MSRNSSKKDGEGGTGDEDPADQQQSGAASDDDGRPPSHPAGAGPPVDDFTRALSDLRSGDALAHERLVAQVYAHLRALAGSYFRHYPPGQTLEPTALVHEAYLRMAGRTEVQWRDRAHCFAMCATVMRGILTDHVRKRAAAKRGGDWNRITLSNVAIPSGSRPIDLVDLDEALNRLAALSERQAAIVQYRFFAGMSEQEIAHVLDVSRSTVAAEWKMARAWLSVQLSETEP